MFHLELLWWYIGGIILYVVSLLLVKKKNYDHLRIYYWLPNIFILYIIWFVITLLHSHSSYLIYKEIRALDYQLILYILYNIIFSIVWVSFLFKLNYKFIALLISGIASLLSLTTLYLYFLISHIPGWLLIPSVIIVLSSTILNYYIWINSHGFQYKSSLNSTKINENNKSLIYQENRGYIIHL